MHTEYRIHVYRFDEHVGKKSVLFNVIIYY